MNEFILAAVAQNKIDLGPKRSNQTGIDLPVPVELKFTLNDEVRQLVSSAEGRFDKLVSDHDLHVCDSVSQIFHEIACSFETRYCITKDTARIISKSSKHLQMLGPSL